MEEKILNLLMQDSHFWLAVGIMAFLFFLKSVGPVGDLLFSDRWKWSIPILNLGLSSLGIFVLKMTTVTTLGMKLILVFLITAVTTYGYELVKPLLKKLFPKIFGIAPSNEKHK